MPRRHEDRPAEPPAGAAGVRPNRHPALAGREQEMAALVDQLRRLIELTVTCELPREVAADAGSLLGSLNERLAAHLPDQAHPRFTAPSADAPVPDEDPASQEKAARADTGWHLATMVDSMPYDVVVGRYNPLALPLTVELRPPKAYARGRFTHAYEGAPGWVHGAVIAGAFDLVLTAANHLEAAAGPTTRLDIRYLRPTLLDEDAAFEAWIDHREGRRVTSKGLLIQQDKVRVEAEGEFVALDRSRFLDTSG